MIAEEKNNFHCHLTIVLSTLNTSHLMAMEMTTCIASCQFQFKFEAISLAEHNHLLDVSQSILHHLLYIIPEY